MAAELRVARVETTATAPVTVDSGDVRTAAFDLRQEPVTAHAVARLGPPPDPGSLVMQITLDPVPLSARLGCGPANAVGIRTAELVVTGPPWADITLGRLEADPAVCHAPPGLPTRSGWRWYEKAAVVGAFVLGVFVSQ